MDSGSSKFSIKALYSRLIKSKKKDENLKDIKAKNASKQGSLNDDISSMTPEQLNSKMMEYKKLGNLCFQHLDYDQAIKEYKVALQYKETSVIYSNIARCHTNLKNYHKCIEYCAFALSLDRNNFKAHAMLGDSLVQLSEIENWLDHLLDAQDNYNKAIKSCHEANASVHIVEIKKKAIDAQNKYHRLKRKFDYDKLVEFIYKANFVMSKKRQEIEASGDMANLELHIKHQSHLDALTEEKLSKYEDHMPDRELNLNHYEWVITYDIMNDPYTTSSGYSYEKECIVDYLKRDNRDPHTREFTTPNMLYENKALKRAIESYKIENDL